MLPSLYFTFNTQHCKSREYVFGGFQSELRWRAVKNVAAQYQLNEFPGWRFFGPQMRRHP
jgi:hypothetical protein